MFKGKRYYGDFLASDEGISTNILADRLQRLERHGIVEKKSDEMNRSRAIYRLTKKGKELLPIMLEITAWSGKHDSKSNAPQVIFEGSQARSKTFDGEDSLAARLTGPTDRGEEQLTLR